MNCHHHKESSCHQWDEATFVHTAENVDEVINCEFVRSADMVGSANVVNVKVDGGIMEGRGEEVKVTNGVANVYLKEKEGVYYLNIRANDVQSPTISINCNGLIGFNWYTFRLITTWYDSLGNVAKRSIVKYLGYVKGNVPFPEATPHNHFPIPSEKVCLEWFTHVEYEKYGSIYNTNTPNIKTSVSVPATAWESDTTYAGYGYKAKISISGVTTKNYVQVVFGVADTDSGNYASVVEVNNGYIEIYGKVNTAITIKTIAIW